MRNLGPEKLAAFLYYFSQQETVRIQRIFVGDRSNIYLWFFSLAYLGEVPSLQKK